jgi:hypothetical protein
MVQRILGAVNFPAHKDDIRQAADDEGAPDEAMRVIDKLPDQVFDSPQDVLDKLPGGIGNKIGSLFGR